ncbi:MAG: flagellar basal body-associated FliL family protein [Lachnospiraceae bacterium]|nr:flagellar basal body-associated FliL family protein [Lachnospiraceae bacterium]
MRKNLISIIILALCIVNLVLNALMVFVFVPAIKKTDNLVTEIAAILNLELREDGDGVIQPSIEDVQIYTLTEATTINLKNDGTGTNAYAIIGVSISMDGSSKDYESVSTKLGETESWVFDVTRSVVQEYTYTEINDAEIQKLVKREITEGLQEKYQTECIYDVTFSQFTTQQFTAQ